MKSTLRFLALVACLTSLVACRGSRPAEEPALPDAAQVFASSQNAPLPPKTSSAQSEDAPVASLRPAASDSPFVPKNPGLRISRVNVPDNLVALTFDDGPHGSLTPRILDILGRYGARGTFFVLGQNASRFPGILRRAVAEGHEIGSHTWSHVKMTTCGREKLFSEMNRTRDAILNATGRAPAVMRPPYGAINASTLQAVYSAYGTPAILWDVDTNDWRKPGVQTVISRAVNGARSGSVILVHDIHASTADAIEGIVKGLQARGFRLVTVSELIAAGRRAAGRRAAGGSAAGGSAPARTPAGATLSAVPAPAPAPAALPPAALPALPEPGEQTIRANAPETMSDNGTMATVRGSEALEAVPAPSLPVAAEVPSANSPVSAPPTPALPALRLRTPPLAPIPAEGVNDRGVIPASPSL